jgi:hypothetical protein
MRFQKPDGSPVANVQYRITWGSGQAPMPVGQTSSDGTIEEELDGRFTIGFIDFGDSYSNKGPFEPHFRVWIDLLKPPPPPAKHKRPGDLLKKPDDPPPSGSPPSKKDEPEPPAAPGPQDPGQGTPAPMRPDLVAFPPDRAPRDFNPEGRSAPPKVYETKPPPAVPERVLEYLDRTAASYHEKQVRVFQIAWRLHNLGYLGWPAKMSFPIDSDRHPILLDALARYTYKFGLKRVAETDLHSPDDALSEVWDHIKKNHDYI